MALIRSQDAPRYPRPGVIVTGLAAPSRGAQETCLFRLTIEPGTEVSPHTLDREEIFFALSGAALATLGTEQHTVRPGDALLVPPQVVLRLSVLGEQPFEAVAALPVGGQATPVDGDGAPFSPPWTV